MGVLKGGLRLMLPVTSLEKGQTPGYKIGLGLPQPKYLPSIKKLLKRFKKSCDGITDIVITTMGLKCEGRGGEMKLIVFIRDAISIIKILTHLGEAVEAPKMQYATAPASHRLLLRSLELNRR